jgi:hypothetical protein
LNSTGASLDTYSHSNDKVPGPFLELENAGDGARRNIGDDDLNDEDEGDYAELNQLRSGQLGRQFGKD